MNLTLEFKYPLHTIVEEEEFARKTKVEEAKDYLLTQLTRGKLPEQELRREAKSQDITDYAFHTAIRELKDTKKIIAIHAGGRGNRKVLKLVKRSE